MGCSPSASGTHSWAGVGWGFPAAWTMRPATARSAEDPAGRSPSTRFPLVPRGRPCSPTCRLSAHGCGGGGSSSGREDLLAPPERNWTTAMRMWCSTRTMLAAARPPAGPAAALGQRVRDSFAGVRASVRPGPAPNRPLPAPRPPGPAHLRASVNGTSQLVGSSDPHQSPRTSCHFPYLCALKILPAGPGIPRQGSRLSALRSLLLHRPPFHYLSGVASHRPLSCMITSFPPPLTYKVLEPGHSPRAERLVQ